MIIVRLQGGLGNQMFQAATGIALAKYHNTKLKLDLSFLKKHNVTTDTFTARYYELDIFDYKFDFADSRDLSVFFPNRTQILKRFNKKTGKSVILNDIKNTTSFFNKTLKNTYLNGYWQNQHFFLKHKEDVLNIFKFKEPENLFNKKNTVAVHIRRGDYLINKAAKDVLGVLPQDYYFNAFDFIFEKVSNSIFYIFSDDINWAKNNFKYKNINFVFAENQNPCADLNQMSLCEHNIIANSSFSWWGAWLNRNPDKIVIAPQKWYADEEKNRKSKIIPQNWIQL